MQVQPLREYGCNRIYKDKFQNRHDHRDGLRRMLKSAKPGYKIVVYKNDAIFASTHKMVEILVLIGQKHVDFVSLSDSVFNTHNDKNRFLFSVFSLMDKFLADLVRERRAKIKNPRKKTSLMGRPKGVQKATLNKYVYAEYLYEFKKITIDAACEKAVLSKSSYYRIRRMYQNDSSDD